MQIKHYNGATLALKNPSNFHIQDVQDQSALTFLFLYSEE